MLAGDGRQLGDRRLQPLRILGRVPHADVQHDLLEPRNLVRVLEPKLLLQLGPHLLLVEVPQPGPRRGLDRLGRSGRSLRLRRTLFLGSLGLLLLLLLLGLLVLLRLFFLLLFFVCHFFLPGDMAPGLGYRTRGIGWPDFTAIRSSLPSLS